MREKTGRFLELMSLLIFYIYLLYNFINHKETLLYLLRKYYKDKSISEREKEKEREIRLILVTCEIRNKKIFYSSVIRVSKGTTSRNHLLRFAVARPQKKDQKHEPV